MTIVKFQKIDELKKELHHLQPLPPALIKQNMMRR